MLLSHCMCICSYVIVVQFIIHYFRLGVLVLNAVLNVTNILRCRVLQDDDKIVKKSNDKFIIFVNSSDILKIFRCVLEALYLNTSSSFIGVTKGFGLGM